MGADIESSAPDLSETFNLDVEQTSPSSVDQDSTSEVKMNNETTLSSEGEEISTDNKEIISETQGETTVISIVEEMETTKLPGETVDTVEVTTLPMLEVTTLSTLPVGDCMKNGEIYKNGENVPSSKCEENCLCQDGMVNCDVPACPPAPPQFLRCASMETDQCCPSYNCSKYSQ